MTPTAGVLAAWVGLVAWGLLVALLARAAFRGARRRAARRLPSALVDELREHKLGCLGEPTARVDLELRLLLPAAPCGARMGAWLGRAPWHRVGSVMRLRRTGTVAR